MLTSKLVSAPAARPAAFTFPGVFRSYETGSFWLAKSATEALRIVPATRGRPGDVADAIHEITTAGCCISPEDYEQVTEPVTITFNP